MNRCANDMWSYCKGTPDRGEEATGPCKLDASTCGKNIKNSEIGEPRKKKVVAAEKR